MLVAVGDGIVVAVGDGIVVAVGVAVGVAVAVMVAVGVEVAGAVAVEVAVAVMVVVMVVVVVGGKMTDAELKHNEHEKWERSVGLFYPTPREIFWAGWDAARANPDPRVEKLVEALKRLRRVGPPSRSCKGDEWANVCLQDNCEIAEAALAEWEKGE